MMRRADDIDRAISGWQAMRRDFGPAAPAALTEIIERELDKLRKARQSPDR